MNRIIINLNPLEKDKSFAIEQSLDCIIDYTNKLGRDGSRITATWDSCKHLIVYHDKLKEVCIYSFKMALK